MKKSLIIGWRNIKKNGIYSIINISGLSIGIAVVVLILFWVSDELSYNHFHHNLEEIYTVYEHQQYSEGHDLFTGCSPFPLSGYLKDNFGEIKKATTYADMGKLLLSHEEKTYKEGPVIFTDENFLNIFSFDILEGSRDILKSDDRVVITQNIAHLFFGDESPIGQIIKIEGDQTLTVGAVAAKPPKNSSIDFEILIPVKALEKMGANMTAWGNNWPNTVILLNKGTDVNDLGTKIIDVCKDKGQENTTLHLFPFKDEHLYSYSGEHNRAQYIYQFLAIAFILILIGSINFVNLSIAQAEKRWSEIGVRKSLGADKANLIELFFTEQGTMIFFSLVLSIVFVLAFLPGFNAVSGKIMHTGLLMNTNMLWLLIAAVATVLILSVGYPSVYLSSLNPVLAIRKTKVKKHKSLSLKSALVVTQFILAVVLISGSIIIALQIKYVNNYDLGYNKNNLIYIPLDGNSRAKHEALKQDFKKMPGVLNLTRTDKLPFYGGNSSWGHDWEGKDPENKVLICKMCVDKDFIETMGISMAAGQTFPEYYDEVIEYDDLNSPRIILNREAIKRMNMKDPVGKIFSLWGEKDGKIVGVTEDFNFESLHVSVEPLLLTPLTDSPRYLIVRVNPDYFSQTLSNIKHDWSEIVPQTNCEIGFFDTRLENMYRSELRISTLFRYFSFIAIFISCIGLFGLSMFVIERRRKEIGIRKVNGAKISEVMILLNKDFIRWVVIAFLIATPVAYYTMTIWLENFAYKTELSWWIFALAGLLAMGIALLTVSWQSWKAANRNPVEALRYE
jgi:ABC-type antimicrobial peptide transport system permease subunit